MKRHFTDLLRERLIRYNKTESMQGLSAKTKIGRSVLMRLRDKPEAGISYEYGVRLHKFLRKWSEENSTII